MSSPEMEDSAKFVKVADSPLIAVKISLTSGQLFCKCKAAPENKRTLWTNMLLPLASNSAKQTVAALNMVEVDLPLIAACANMGGGEDASEVHLACSPNITALSNVFHQLEVPMRTAAKLLSRRAGVTPVPAKCEMNTASMIHLEENWRGVGGVKEEEECRTAMVMIDKAKLSKWNACHPQRLAELHLLSELTSSLQKHVSFLQVLPIDVDSCIGDIDRVKSHLPLLVPFQSTPTQIPSRLPPEDLSGEHARGHVHGGHVHEARFRRARRNTEASCPLPQWDDRAICPHHSTAHINILENCPMGTVLTKVLAPMGWPGGGVSFSITPEPISDIPFTINASTGVILTSK